MYHFPANHGFGKGPESKALSMPVSLPQAPSTLAYQPRQEAVIFHKCSVGSIVLAATWAG